MEFSQISLIQQDTTAIGIITIAKILGILVRLGIIL